MTTPTKLIPAELASRSKRLRNARAYYKKHAFEVERTIEQFDSIENCTVISADVWGGLFEGEINISLSGNKLALQRFMKLMFTKGYQPSARPEENDVSFATFWYFKPRTAAEEAIADREDMPKYYIRFESTECKRVQVGTRMVEQPVYEVRCGDEGDE